MCGSRRLDEFANCGRPQSQTRHGIVADREVDTSRSELRALQAQIGEFQRNISQLESLLATLERQAAGHQRELTDATNQHHHVAEQLAESRTRLEGAVARPRTHAVYAGADVALQAAVLAHGIAESQVFVDGNKRTALIALLTFLDINGWMLDTDDVTLAEWMLDLSQGLNVEDLAHRLRRVLVEAK